MSITYDCSCGKAYKLPSITDDILCLVNEETPVIEFIAECPHCGTKGIKGGEHFYDIHIEPDGEEVSKEGIMLFGQEFLFDKHKEEIAINRDGTLLVKYPKFIGIPVEDGPEYKRWQDYIKHDP